MSQAACAPTRPAVAKPVASPTAWIVGFGLLLALRIGAASAIPLTQDEAYYRLWAQHLSLGYYDHPPGVAWAIALGVRLFGDSALGVRAAAVAAGAATTLAVVDLARATGFSETTARRAGLWYVAAPLIGFGSILALPDTFASLGWVLCLRALAAVERRPAAWVMVGLAAGLALLCKYSALFLAPVAAWRLLSVDRGRGLRTPWPWIGLVVAAALVSPNIVWNAAHHWATFGKQFGRVAAARLAPAHLPLFLLASAALINPLTLPFLWRAWRRRKASGQNLATLNLLWFSGLPFFLYLLLHSLHDAVQAHWPAPLYPVLMILAASGAQAVRGERLRRLAQAAPAAGLAASTLALLHLAAPWSDWSGADPARTLRGWSAFADRLQDERIRTQARWVGMLNYAEAAELSAAWRDTAPLLQVTERRRYAFTAPPEGISGPGLVADLERRMASARLGDCFRVVRPLGSVWRGDQAGQRYAVVWVDQPRRDVARDGCRTFHNGRADP